MNGNDIKRIVREHPKWNFYAMALTPWHVIGVDICIEHLRRIGVNINGCVFIKTHKQTGKCISEVDFNNNCSGITYIDAGIMNRPIKEQLVGYISAFKDITLGKRGGKTFYVICFDEVDFLWVDYLSGSNIKFLLCDDGLGGYISFANQRFSQNVNVKGRVFAWLYLLAMKGKETIYNHYFKCFNRIGLIIDRRLLTRRGSSYITNDEIIDEYRLYINHDNKSTEHKGLIEGHIILATDSFIENKMSYGGEDMQMFDCVYDVLCQLEIKDKMIIKPHPRELNVDRYKKYGCRIFDSSVGSIESLVAETHEKPLAVISLYSSAMVSLSVLFNIKTISMGKMLLKTSLNKYLKKDIRQYSRMFRGMVYFPNNQSDLYEIVKSFVG